MSKKKKRSPEKKKDMLMTDDMDQLLGEGYDLFGDEEPPSEEEYEDSAQDNAPEDDSLTAEEDTVTEDDALDSDEDSLPEDDDLSPEEDKARDEASESGEEESWWEKEEKSRKDTGKGKGLSAYTGVVINVPKTPADAAVKPEQDPYKDKDIHEVDREDLMNLYPWYAETESKTMYSEAEEEEAKEAEKVSFSHKRMAKLSNHEISVFCGQMSMLLKGGIAPWEGVNIMLEDTTDKGGRAILTQMRDVVNKGEKFHTAVEATGVFPDYVTHMIAIGEESGNLDTVLDALNSFYDREEGLRDMVRSAVSYPLLMIILMFIVIMVLITRVLPIFAQVFAQLGTGMNTFSESLLNFGRAMNRSSLAIIIILALLTGFFLILANTDAGQRQFARFAENFSLTKKLYQDIAAGRFASGMALTLASGMDTYQSLQMVDKLVENKAMSDKIQSIISLISQEGMSFPEAVEKQHIFTQLYNRMVLVGFRSGSMDVVMRQIADQYEKHTDRKIYSMISVVEPTLIIILSVIVGMILLSVIMPLMGIMSSIG